MQFSNYKKPDKPVKQRRKINFLFVILFGIFIVILIKLINIQIIDSEKYKIAARKLVHINNIADVYYQNHRC